MKDLTLIKSINTEVLEGRTIIETIESNCVALFQNPIELFETADEFLAQFGIDLQRNGTIDQLENKVALYTALEMLSLSSNREAYGVNNKSKFKSIMDLVQRDGNTSQVSSKVQSVDGEPIDLIHIGQAAAARYQANMQNLQNFANADQATKQNTINMIGKMRLNYEKARNTLSQQAPAQNTDQQAPTATNQPAPQPTATTQQQAPQGI